MLGDFEDFLRQQRLKIWDKNAPEALAVRRGYEATALASLQTATPETAANILLCWINQASYLLGRQLRRLERDFLDHGGFIENLYKARSQARASQSDASDQSDTPRCPICGSAMRLRTARQGPHAG
ncbi:MAG: four helix bundle suffix domain-containing protein [Verrucomicrobiia bacterium]